MTIRYVNALGENIYPYTSFEYGANKLSTLVNSGVLVDNDIIQIGDNADIDETALDTTTPLVTKKIIIQPYSGNSGKPTIKFSNSSATASIKLQFDPSATGSIIQDIKFQITSISTTNRATLIYLPETLANGFIIERNEFSCPGISDSDLQYCFFIWKDVYNATGNELIIRNNIFNRANYAIRYYSSKITGNFKSSILNNSFYKITNPFFANLLNSQNDSRIKFVGNIVHSCPTQVYDASSQSVLWIVENCFYNSPQPPQNLNRFTRLNYTADPLFVDPDNNNFELSSGSPCINQNYQSSTWTYTDTCDVRSFYSEYDCKNKSRVSSAGIDAGALEFQQGNITLTSPANNSLAVGNVIKFVFTVPSFSGTLVFRIELDMKSEPISDSLRYKKNESRYSTDNKVYGKWEVKNGSGNWIEMTTAGLDTSFIGRDARVTLRKQDTTQYPDQDGTWYWKISAGNGMVNNGLYNQVIFGQAIF